MSIGDKPSVWKYLALSEEELEQTDLVAINLVVAVGIPRLRDLDIKRYCGVVDEWTARFAGELSHMEHAFRRTPDRWKGDLRFFRVGMLAGFLGQVIGARYNEAQKHAESVRYTDPSDLFLNGVIDTKQGTCGNMAALHVAMCRRMGWPVSLASVKGHFISRFDDGEVIHNIEMSSVRQGTFASDPDAFYIEKFDLPARAIECGSDLRALTAREMIGIFVALRARHFWDIGDFDSAEADYCLARALFPRHRRTYIAASVAIHNRGQHLFDSGEVGYQHLCFAHFGPPQATPEFSPAHGFKANLSGIFLGPGSSADQPNLNTNNSVANLGIGILAHANELGCANR